MPIYEYVCPACKNKFEQLRPLNESDKAAECPKCHKPAPRKMSTFAAFTMSLSGVPKTIAGTGGSSCSNCSSGDCSSCAS